MNSAPAVSDVGVARVLEAGFFIPILGMINPKVGFISVKANGIVGENLSRWRWSQLVTFEPVLQMLITMLPRTVIN